MLRSLLLLLAVCDSCRATDEDIVAASGSPYTLAKFVSTHDNFDWQPLWQILAVDGEQVFLPRCEGSHSGVPPCTAELIAVEDPDQILVLLEHSSSNFLAILRFRTVSPGLWRFWGAYSPHVKYFRPEHKLGRIGAKPALILTEQGNAGTGLSSTLQAWIDLTRDSFEPVLRFVRDGHFFAFPDGIDLTVWGSVTTIATQPTERITVSRSIQFDAVRPNDSKLPLGRRADTSVYVRTADGTFQFDPKLSTATDDDFETFYEDLESDFTSDEFLAFNHSALTAIAKGQDQNRRLWLSQFLNDCEDSPLVRTLRSLLSQH